MVRVKKGKPGGRNLEPISQALSPAQKQLCLLTSFLLRQPEQGLLMALLYLFSASTELEPSAFSWAQETCYKAGICQSALQLSMQCGEVMANDV